MAREVETVVHRRLLSRAREARLLQVLGIYLAASWLVLQITALLRQEFQLPQWVTPLAVVLLLIGLVVVSATAWIQSQPQTSTRAERDDIPGTWEIDLVDVGQSMARGRFPHLTWARAILGGVVAFSLLFGMSGVYVLMREPSLTPGIREATAAAAPAIAIVPFTVSGPGLEQWREGMVDLLSTSLDGVAGLRTIDSRTLLAAWRANAADQDPGLESSLRSVRPTGARYAVVGSALSSGRDLRLNADVYDLERQDKLGHAQAEGSPDNIFRLVDELSIGIVRAVAGRTLTSAPRVDLASVTTTSLPALNAFLQGESRYRMSDWPAATQHYRQAVELDSTFALAWHRLGTTSQWLGGPVDESAPEPLRRAARLADRLSERDAILARAELATYESSMDGLESLKRAVQTYPDDAEAWYLLGEAYFHTGDGALAQNEDFERAFLRAIELDPAFAPAYVHLMEKAFWHPAPDSAKATLLIGKYGVLVPEQEEYLREATTGFSLAFGDSARRAETWAAVDTLSSRTLVLMAISYLIHPRFRALEDSVLTKVSRRADAADWAVTFQYYARLNQGKLRDALLTLEDPKKRENLASSGLYSAWATGLPIPAGRLDAEVLPGRGSSGFLDRAFFGGAYAADRLRWPVSSAAVQTLREDASGKRSEGDSTVARSLEAMAQVLEGRAAWKRGDREKAFRLLEDARPRIQVSFDASYLCRWWLGELSEELDRMRDAERYFGSAWLNPHWRFRLAKVHEKLGDSELARRDYEFFIEAWKDADPELQPMVEEARQAVKRLSSVIQE